MRATLEGDSPPSTNSTARHRRRCSSLAVPIGLVILHYTDVQTPGQALPTLDSVMGVRPAAGLALDRGDVVRVDDARTGLDPFHRSSVRVSLSVRRGGAG